MMRNHMASNNLTWLNNSSEFGQFADSILKDSKDIKKSLVLDQNYFGVYVFAIAINNNFDLNKRIEISTQFGTPLTPEVHDTVRDVYILEGVETFELGFVPVSYRLIIEEADWDTHVPLPFSVIKRYISNDVKNQYFNWSHKFKDANHRIQYLQILGSM